MKMHTTNYFNSFIEIAEDCPVQKAEIPPLKGKKPTVANLQFEMIQTHPYAYTSDDVLFYCFVAKKQLGEEDLAGARMQFFSKGQACLRCSPLVKHYGWGIHHDAEGKVALYGYGTDDYIKFKQDKTLKVMKGIRSKRNRS